MKRPLAFVLVSLFILPSVAAAFSPEQLVRIYNNRSDRFGAPATQPATSTVLYDVDFNTAGTCNASGWTSVDLTTPIPAQYGDFAALFQGLTFVQEDPCESRIDCYWGFFNNSTFDYSCGGFPAQAAVPYQDFNNKYIHNEVWSQTISWSGTGTRAVLEFDVYNDLALDGLVFYTWHVRSMVGGNWGQWKNHEMYHYGSFKNWMHQEQEIGDLISMGATDIQIALGVQDLCDIWCGVVGTGACHSHSPLFGHIKVTRLGSQGPSWEVRPFDLFQDNFSSNGLISGTVRADIAHDLRSVGNPAPPLPGDSVAVWVDDPEYGLRLVGGRPDVQIFVRVDPAGQPGKSGAALSGDPVTRWPLLTSVVGPHGYTWDVFRMDVCYLIYPIVIPGRYCFDFDDALFNPGDIVYYFFAAVNGNNKASYWSEPIGTTEKLSEAFDAPTEFTCLPRTQLTGGDILYIDHCDGWAAQPYFDDSFKRIGILDQVDRFDVRAPTSMMSNGIASRVVSIPQQIIAPYRKIIWNTGDLYPTTIWKSADADLIANFLDNAPVEGGVYLTGDNISDFLTPALLAHIDHTVVSKSHKLAGFPLSPLVVGEPGSCFYTALPESGYVDGCGMEPSAMLNPATNGVEVIQPQGTAQLEMTYDGTGSPSDGAVISQQMMNTAGVTMHVILSGFSYHHLVDNNPMPSVPYRAVHLYRVLTCLQNVVPFPTGIGPEALHNGLLQNFPNPFNPQTTIRYSIRESGWVNLSVFDVAGRLVRTLVDERQSPSSDLSVDWDGRDSNGQAVASGVYFYRLTAPGFTKTRKMVLLK